MPWSYKIIFFSLGNQVERLLKNVDTLKRILKGNRRTFENETVQNFIGAFYAFDNVRDAVFGTYVVENFMEIIKDFSYHYMVLVNYFQKQKFITFNVTLKVSYVCNYSYI